MDSRGSHNRSVQSPGHDASNWHELRALLTGPEQRQLARILKRLDDPVRRAEEIAKALPDSLSLGVANDGRIARSLQPIMDSALKASVRKNPKALADAIYPALGPAIRKSISATLMSMVQSLNHVLNQSFSVQGLKWRIEALRTQRPFAEVILLNTLIYRVEQIYLIHRQSGIVLEHADANQTESRDPDLVSGMLTAIQDFVRDSFDAESGEILDTLRMDGDHSVWIEQGSQIIVAVVIRGTPPLELRNRFRELLDKVQLLYADTLHEFDGQVASFAMIKPDLEDALISKMRTDQTRISPLFGLLVAAVAGMAIIWAIVAFNNHRDWQRLLTQLRNEAGIVVTSAERHWGKYHIMGLKDNLAADPQQIIASSGIDPDKLQITWQPYQALGADIVLRRANNILQPPATVELSLAEGILTARGLSEHDWIRRFRRDAATIAGVHGIDDQHLIDRQMDLLVSARTALETQSIPFDLGLAQLTNNQITRLQPSLESIKTIQNLSQAMQRSVKITVLGHTDPSGLPEFNLQLSYQRAQFVLSYLIRNGADPNLLVAMGAGPTPASTPVISRRHQGALRHVTFMTQINPE